MICAASTRSDRFSVLSFRLRPETPASSSSAFAFAGS